MLQREQTPGGLVFYFSPLLRSAGIRHAFSTRIGGISHPPFDSLNLGNPNGCGVQDDYAHIWDNYRLLQEAIGCATERPCRVHQVHGGRVVRVRRDEAFDTNAQADAIVTDDPSRPLSVRVADCVPVLLASAGGERVAAVHAGWRGIVTGVVAAAIDELTERGAAQGLLAAIGPSISAEAFEVGEEVLAAFWNAFGGDAPCRRTREGKGEVDLREAVRRQLIAAGVSPNRIDSTDRCTYRDAEDFFSHRRDNGITGRMAAIIQANA